MNRGHVRKRGQKWCFVIDLPPVDGKRKQRWQGGFATRREAQAALNAALVEVDRGTYVPPSKLTVKEFLVETWLPAVRATVRESTWASYEAQVEKHIVTHIGGVQLRTVSAAHLNAMYADLLSSGRLNGKGGLSGRSVRYVHTILHRGLRDAVRWGYVARNVAELADPPRPTRSTTTWWSADELGQFIFSVRGHRLEALYVLAATTGMRRGELLGLRWQDVDLTTRRLAVRQTIISVGYEIRLSTPKTDRSRRSVVIDDLSMQVLRQHKTRQATERLASGIEYAQKDFVFCREDGQPLHPESISSTFERLIRTAKLPRIRFHDLRHSYASVALSAGVHQKAVSERLGHSTVAVTLDTYSHVMPAVAEDAAEQVAKLIFRDAASAVR